ncbi:hypothetical protein CKO51_15955 [Rhodopirellula sp. SM50]|nr:hypothetical protein CKO51_15955 [Rhodopirellula sp. SM50]
MTIESPQPSIDKRRIQFCSPGTGTYATTDPTCPDHQTIPQRPAPVAASNRESRLRTFDDDGD